MTRSEEADRILAEWFDAYQRGDTLDPAALLREHPELEQPLREGLDALEVLGEPRSDSGPAMPETIGDYRLIREIGRGGMGVVYEAEQISMRRAVALKILTPSLTSAAKSVKRFRREARTAGRLHHTNIVPVHGMGQEAGHWYYAMDLVKGRPLSDVLEMLRREPADRRSEHGLELVSGSTASRREKSSGTVDAAWFSRIAEVFCGVAEALEIAHRAGVIHRDIKPSNLLLDADGLLKIVDFGLAHLDTPGPSMTLTGDLVGTPTYMSPEQAMAKRIHLDHRTDIYSLGATLYEVLTLRPPFAADSLQELCAQIVTKEPQSPRRLDDHVPRDLETIVLKAMDKDRDRRYQHAEELAHDLRRFAEGDAIRARRVSVVERAWRIAKRNKTVTGLASAASIAVAVGVLFALQAGDEADRRARLEYDVLLASAQRMLPASWGHTLEGPFGSELAPGRTSRDVLTDAIALRPDRADAYWLRALAVGRTVEQRLRDVDDAEAHGLAATTAELLRAYLRGADRDAAALPAAQPEIEPATPLGWYAHARVLERQGMSATALERLELAITNAPPESAVHLLAIRRRATIRQERGDTAEALADLEFLSSRGDSSFQSAVMRARLLEAVGEPDRARALREQLARALDHTSALGAYRRAVLHLESSELGDAARLADTALAHASASARTRAYAWLLQARIAKSRGELEAALTACDKALALRNLAHAHHRRAELLLALDRPEAALDAVDRARARACCEYVWVLRGRVLADLGRNDEAHAAFDEAARRMRVAAPELARADLLVAIGELEAARLACDRALETEPDSVSARHVRGRIALLLDDDFGARRDFEAALELDPDHVATRLQLGRILDPEAGLVHFDRVVAIDPEHGEGWARRARALEGLEQFDEAVVAYERALAAERAPAWTARGHARALGLAGRTGAALAAFNRLVEENPDSDHVLLDRAALRGRIGELRGAIRDYRTALRDHPIHARAWLALAELLDDAGRRQNALEVLAEGLEANPESPSLHLARSRLLAADRQLDSAIEAAERAVSLAPTNADAWNHFGRLRMIQGDSEAAHGAFARAVTLDPDSGACRHNVALADFDAGRLEDALGGFRAALDLGYEASRWQLAITLELLGRYREAVDEMRVCAKDGLTAPRERKLRETALLLSTRGPELDELSPLQRWCAQGHELAKRGRFAQAAASFERASTHGSLDANALRRFGYALLRLRRTEEGHRMLDRAIAPLDAAIVADPADGLARIERASCLTLTNRLDEAEAEALRAAEHPPVGDLEQARWCDLLVEQAGALARADRRGSAVTLYDAILEIDRSHDPALQNRIVELEQLGRLTEARAAARAALELAPDRALLHVRWGLLQPEGVWAAQSIRSFETALALGLSDTNALITVFNMIPFEQARLKILAAEKVLETQRGNSELALNNRRVLWSTIATCEASRGNHERACDAFAELARCDPDFRPYEPYQASLLALGRYEDALRVGRAALESGVLADATAGTKLRNATCLRRLGRYREAHACFEGFELSPLERKTRDEIDTLATRESELRTLVESGATPSSPADCVLAAEWAIDHGHDDRGVTLYTEAFGARPELLLDHGRAAASAAVRTARSATDPSPLRTKAREWLERLLAEWQARVSSAASTREDAIAELQRWKADPDLTRLRARQELSALPDDERRSWLALWSELERTSARLEGESYPALKDRADQLRLAGRHEEALQMFDAALATLPKSALLRRAGVQRGRGWSLSALGRAEESLAAVEQALELRAAADQEVMALDLRHKARNLISLGRLEEAEATARRALEVEPDYGLNPTNVAEILVARGEQAAARPYLLHGLTLTIADPRLSGNASAYQVISQLTALYPDDAELQGELARWDALRHERTQRAWQLAELERSIEAAQRYLTAGRPARAIKELERVLAVDFRSATALLWLSRAYLANGDRQAAVGALREAQNSDSAGAFTRFATAVSMRELGEYQESLQAYRDGIRLAEGAGESLAEHLDPLDLRSEHPSEEWLAEAQRLAAAAEQLGAIIGGSAEAADAAECEAAAVLAERRGNAARAAELRGQARELARR